MTISLWLLAVAVFKSHELNRSFPCVICILLMNFDLAKKKPLNVHFGLVPNAGSIFIRVNHHQNGNLNTTSSLPPSGGGGKAEMTPI